MQRPSAWLPPGRPLPPAGKERALPAVIAEIIETVELTDEQRERLTEPMGGEADEG